MAKHNDMPEPFLEPKKWNRLLFSFATDFKYIKPEKRQQPKTTDFSLGEGK